MSLLSDPLPAASRPDAARHADRCAATIRPAALLMGLSGFAGLGYQIVWTQQLGTWLGHEIVAVLAVVAAFFGGLALGAQALGARIAASAHPLRWYAALEAAIGLWGALLVLLLPAAGAGLAGLIGTEPSPLRHWAVAFAGPLLLLLPATAAMGATLPAIERVTGRLRSEGYAIGGLYAANTLGAVLGVLACSFLLVPRFGLASTALACAALNLLCAAAAMSVLPKGHRGAVPATGAASSAAASGGRRWLALLGLTGLLGIGYEVVVVRALSQLAENTVYTFALLLAVYLLGSAAGAAFYQRRLAGSSDPAGLLHRLLCALAAACALGLLMLTVGDAAQAGIQALLARGFGPGLGSALAAEAALAVAAFALPTVAMGALFSHLCVQAKAAGLGLGSALAANMLGAALAPLLFGVLLLPLLGPGGVLALIAAGYLLLLPLPQWRRPAAWVPALGIAGLALSGASLNLVDVPEGGRLLSHRDGVRATVSVVEDAQGVSRLHIDNRQPEGSNATRFADARQAWLPLLLHPEPRSALFLGLGTGVTAAAAAEDPTLEVQAVELLPEVIAAAPHFVPGLGTEAAPLRVLAADARRFVRADGPRYDVIVSDLFHPARSGAGALYTVEHFAAVRERLAAGGLFCQWLPLHQLDLDTLRSIVLSFLAVYPDAGAVLATHSLDTPVLGLVARPDAARLEAEPLRRRLTDAALPQRVNALELGDEFALLGSFVAGPQALRRFAATAPLNTDDRPVVVYGAPRITYAPDSQPRERLTALLAELQPSAAELLGPPADAPAERWQQRLEAYWAARTRFIEVGQSVRLSPDVRSMLDQVREPLLEVLRLSPDFRPAYDPLLRMAQALSSIDAGSARALLLTLHRAQPARPEAEQALRHLDAAAKPEPRP